MRSLILLVALASAGCLRSTQFQCSNDTACGASGVCEATGYCSFPDTDCPSGRRYGDSAGGSAGQCTSGGTGSDGGMIDTPVAIIDGRMIDAPVGVGCPSGYAAVAGAEAGHLYKIVTAADTWDAQQLACRATTTAANLFVPNDLAGTELAALDAVVGETSYWIGVNDIVTDGTFVALPDNLAQAYLPWEAGAPSNGVNPPQNCVAVITATNQFNDLRCNNTNLPAVCECVP
jgi:hypothetical protein